MLICLEKLVKNTLLFCCLFISFFDIISCKKSDFNSRQTIIDKERFFYLPENAPQVLKRIVSNMRIQDSLKPFVEDFINNQGYPNWQFAKVNVPKLNYRSTESESDTLISVPIVREGRQYVKSVLAIRVNSEIWFRLLDGIRYRELPLDENGTLSERFTARDFLRLMMQYEYEIFGQQRFEITDRAVVADSSSISMGIFSIPNYATQLSFSGGCTIFNYGYYDDYGFHTMSSETVCLYETGDLVYTLNAPYTEGGGGGGGSGNNSSNEECERGFVGITGFEEGGMPLIPCPIIRDPPDSIPPMLSRTCDNVLDSLYQWGMTHNFREQSFIVVRKNDSIYYKNFTIGFSSGDKVKVNYNLDPGEVLLAYAHIHAEDTTNSYRTSFSPEDLIEFNKNANIVGYTAILEVGNARYAFVLENVQLKYLFNISKRGNHVNLWYDLLNSLTSQYPNGQTCTEQTWIQYLGSSSSCGIGFYKTTAPDTNTFTKLN